MEYDSTHSWLVAFGNAVIGFCTLGFMRCLPVFYQSFMLEFDVQYSEVASISGLFCFGLGTGSLLLPFIARKFGYRLLAFITGALYASCYVCSIFATKFIYLEIFCGFFGGFGAAILFFSALVTCNLYFSKHRALATGLATVGIPVGALSLSPLANYLIGQYGWRGAMLILSGLLFNSCASAVLYRASKERVRTKVQLATATNKSATTAGRPKRVLTRRQSAVEVWRSVKQYGDFSIFTSIPYDLALLSSIFYMCGYIGANTFIVPFANGHLKTSTMKSAFTLTLISASEIVSRICTGALGDKKFINRTFLLVITSVIFGVVLILLPFSPSYGVLMFFCLIYGFVSCTYQSMIPVVFADIVGKPRLSQALGYQGFLYNMVLAPSLWLNGLLLDITEDFRVPFFLCSGFIFCSTIFTFCVWLKTKNSE